MERRFLAAQASCPLGCAYCFAKSNSYRGQSRQDYSQRSQRFDIIYPACDGELLLEPNYMEKLGTLADTAVRPVILRFSTKVLLAPRVVRRLAQLNHRLTKEGRGSLVVGISFSTASRIEEIEPGTAPFEKRVEGLRRLAESGVPSTVSLRPLLPFLPASEYAEIVGRTSAYASHYLLGDLYVFENTDFYKRHIARKYTLSTRRVDWLPQRPCWTVVESKLLKGQVRRCINRSGSFAYDCDVELLQNLKDDVIPSGLALGHR